MEFCACQSSLSKMAHELKKHSASSYRSSDSEHYFIHKRRRSNRGGQSDVSKLPPAIQVELVNSSCPKIQQQNRSIKNCFFFLYNSKAEELLTSIILGVKCEIETTNIFPLISRPQYAT